MTNNSQNRFGEKKNNVTSTKFISIKNGRLFK